MKRATIPKTWRPPLQTLRGLTDDPFWLVGGALRDILLGRPTNDIDVVSPRDPSKVARLFSDRLGGSFFPLDEERGTYRVVLPAGTGAEPLQFDFSIQQGKTLEQDLARRDFTINAMAVPLEDVLAGPFERVIDPTKGQRDLSSKTLRHISDKAFQEDPLRLLRAYRFAAELDFKIHPGTTRVLRRHVRRAAQPAPERIREELLKTLATPRAAASFVAMEKTGLLAVLFPEVNAMRRTGASFYGKGGVLRHSLEAMAAFEKLLDRLSFYFPGFSKDLEAHLAEKVSGHPRVALLKLVELFHDVGKPATVSREKGKVHFYGHDAVGAKMMRPLASRLRLTADESRSLHRMVGAHMRPGGLGNAPVVTDRAIFRFFRDLEGDAISMLLVALGDHFTYLSERVKRSKKDPVYLVIRRMLKNYFKKRATIDPPKIIDGNQLMKALKIKPGPVIGLLLEAVREAQSDGTVQSTPEALAFARQLYPTLKPEKP